MKRFRLVILLVIVGLALGWGALRSGWSTPKPVWVPGPVRVVSGSSFKFSYHLWTEDPFAGGKLWVTASATNEQHRYLFDIERGTVLGELRNVDWAFANADVSRLFCAQRASPGMRWARIQVARMKRSLGFKHYDPFPERQYESYWLLDLARHSTEWLGELDFMDGTIDEPFIRSPSGRFGYFKPWAGSAARQMVIADLASGRLLKDVVTGEPVGWWDDQRILFHQADFELTLFDAVTRKNAPFVPATRLGDLVIKGGMTNELKDSFPPQFMTGSDNSFYVQISQVSEPGSDVLFRLERPDGTLKQVNSHFEYVHFPGQLDSRAKQYLFLNGEGGSSLRDVTSGQSRELPQLGGNSPEGAARFYHDDIICAFTNTLWRFRPDGTNPRRIFPPPDPIPR